MWGSMGFNGKSKLCVGSNKVGVKEWHKSCNVNDPHVTLSISHGARGTVTQWGLCGNGVCGVVWLPWAVCHVWRVVTGCGQL